MDFQTLNRRELQALCKLNKIPANMTNIAMAVALKSLETVEGIESFLNSSTSKTGGLSIESPKRIEVSSPRVLHTSPKTTTWKKVSEVMETSLVSCTSKNDPEASSCHNIPNTPVVTATINQGKGAKTTHKGTVEKDITATVESTYTTRRSTRLAAKRSLSVTSKEDLGKPIEEKHDVVVLDESDDNSKNEKVVHVDTTKLDSEIGKVDNLKVKLDEIFGQIEDMDFEERQNGEEVVNADSMEKNVSVNTGDFFVNHKKQKACMNLESLIEVSPIRKKAKIDVNEVLKTPPVSSTRKNDDDVVLDESDENSKIENIVHVDTSTLEREVEKVDNLKVKLVEIFEDVDLEKRQSNFEEKSGQVDNLKPDSEGICNPSESLKVDDDNVVKLMSAEDLEDNTSKNTVDFVNPKKQKASINVEGQPQESLNEVEGIEELLHPSGELPIDVVTSPRALRTSSRKKAKILANEVLKTPLASTIRKNDVASQHNKSEDTANNQNDCIPNTNFTPVVMESQVPSLFMETETSVTSEEDLGKAIHGKNDVVVVVLDESDVNSKIEKVVDVDTSTLEREVEMVDCCGEVRSVEIFENVDSEERQNNYVEKCESLIQEIAVDVRPVIHGEVDINLKQVNLQGKADEITTHDSAIDVTFVNEENQSSKSASDVIDNPTLINSKVLDNKENGEREMEVVVNEKVTNNEKEVVKPKSVINSPSLRQLKKKLKETLLNSPTPIRIKAEEVSDKKENNNVKQPQVNKKEDEKAAKSLENTCSLRQLRKQLKAISEKCNMDANKDDNKVNVLSDCVIVNK